MRAFDLEAAKAGKPLVTRDGRAAKFIAHVPEATNCLFVVICVVDARVHMFTENGKFSSDAYQDRYDLFLADPPKVKKSGWVNVYPLKAKACGELATCNAVYSSFNEALRYSAPHKIATVEIHWEEEAV